MGFILIALFILILLFWKWTRTSGKPIPQLGAKGAPRSVRGLLSSSPSGSVSALPDGSASSQQLMTTSLGAYGAPRRVSVSDGGQIGHGEEASGSFLDAQGLIALKTTDEPPAVTVTRPLPDLPADMGLMYYVDDDEEDGWTFFGKQVVGAGKWLSSTIRWKLSSVGADRELILQARWEPIPTAKLIRELVTKMNKSSAFPFPAEKVYRDGTVRLHCYIAEAECSAVFFIRKAEMSLRRTSSVVSCFRCDDAKGFRPRRGKRGRTGEQREGHGKFYGFIIELNRAMYEVS